MVWKRLVQLSLCCATASAFRDTSPFFLFSTSSLPHIDTLPSQLVAKSSSVSSSVLKAIENCPSDAYVLVSQPGASVRDYEDSNALNLRRRMKKQYDDRVRSVYSIPDVLGSVEAYSIQDHLLKKCGATLTHVNGESYYLARSDNYPQLIKVDFQALPASTKDREHQITMQDSFLNMILDEMSERTYTVIYTTTPPSDDIQAALQQSPKSGPTEQIVQDAQNTAGESAHTDLKRDTEANLVRRQSDNSSDRALFEKYNFLGPGIFMGLFTALILMLLLYVGISAVSGLQVSYQAFSKEMGPAAQKKQQ